MKRVLVVVARRFNGHELFGALYEFQRQGVEYDVASSDSLIRDEVTDGVVKIDHTYDTISREEVAKYDGLMFISGNMSDTEAMWYHPTTQMYVSVARDNGLPIAAICCSVPTIRSAIKGKRVSAFPLVRSLEHIKNAGGYFQNVALTVDGKIVTAEHQMATQEWAEAFAQVVKGESPQATAYRDSGFRPGRRRPMRLPTEVQHLLQKVNKTEPS